MTLAGKFFGLTTAAVFGTLIYLAPGLVTGESQTLATGSLPVHKAQAEPAHAAATLKTRVKSAWNALSNAERAIRNMGETPETIARLEAADTAYFDAVIALETARTSALQIAQIEEADNEYFAAIMALERGQTPARLARLEAADTAYFNAALKLESVEETVQQLAELKLQEAMAQTMIASRTRPAPVRMAQKQAVPVSDEIVTGSISKAQVTGSIAPAGQETPKDPMSAELAKLKQADDAYFEAVIALETKGENPEDLARLKKADDAYFEAVLTIESLEAEAAAKKKTKLASAAAIMPVAPAAAKAVKASPAEKATLKQAHPAKPKAHARKPAHSARSHRMPRVKYHAPAPTRKKARGPVRRIVGGLWRGLTGGGRHTAYK